MLFFPNEFSMSHLGHYHEFVRTHVLSPSRDMIGRKCGTNRGTSFLLQNRTDARLIPTRVAGYGLQSSLPSHASRRTLQDLIIPNALCRQCLERRHGRLPAEMRGVRIAMRHGPWHRNRQRISHTRPPVSPTSFLDYRMASPAWSRKSQHRGSAQYPLPRDILCADG